MEVEIISGSHLEIEWEKTSEASGFAYLCKFPFRYNGVLYYGCTPNADESGPGEGKVLCFLRKLNITFFGVPSSL